MISRFLLTLRSRPEIELSLYLGEYELFKVPRSLFSANGVMNQEKDKCFCRDPENMLSWKWVKWRSCHRCYWSHSIWPNCNGKPHQNQQIKVKYALWLSRKFFRDHFIACEEIRVVFDHHDEKSLNHKQDVPELMELLLYKIVTDATQISHLNIPKFLTSIHTKNK